MKGIIKRRLLWSYLVIAYVFSWALWSVLLITTSPDAMQEGPAPSFFVLAALGGIGPSSERDLPVIFTVRFVTKVM